MGLLMCYYDHDPGTPVYWAALLTNFGAPPA